ncbi:hypothetical protein [Streptomyces sp. MH60]|uniref:hypothetical protein n=1 Tax=Streptomyces sp. MH60 TaxID=1940758 RepID=UPI000D47666F|nr:hypothetical protein [Streptomyces sp. MH60]PPS76719.1 hypothetical protein BZZ08_06631 [Streptomyces sp. MH60]
MPSADPAVIAVIAVSAGDSEITELISLDDRGRNRATISLRNGACVADCALSDYLLIDDCPTTAVGMPYLYFGLPSEAQMMTPPDENDIVVQNGRLFFGVKAANGLAEGKTEQWSYVVLGIRGGGPRTS